ncbi:hypothetical protein EDB19DRAFT_1837272 [Suillus lakei]|nr:hypothetical protein EDB19DRAFT_1837272 [Suillus lakei]
MTSTRAEDYLTKELFIKKNVVTFRSLSSVFTSMTPRSKTPADNSVSNGALNLHIADAANTDALSFATYMVLFWWTAMVYKTRKLNSPVYIYSLSPSVLRDTGMMCQPTVSVRNTDTKGNPALNGKIIGARLKTQTRKGLPKNVPAASSSKITLDARKPVVPQPSVFLQKSEQMTERGKQNEGSKDKEPAGPLAATKEQPKPTGKLDWSKGKNKEQEIISGGALRTRPSLNRNRKLKLRRLRQSWLINRRAMVMWARNR